MPEDFTDKNNALHDKSTNTTDETKDLENCKHSKVQKMRTIVQNFFNHLPAKWFTSELKVGNNKHALQNDAVISRNARKSPHKDLSRGKENTKSRKNANNSCRHRCCNIHQDIGNQLLLQIPNNPFEPLQFAHVKLEEEISRPDFENNITEINDVEVKSLLDDEKGTKSVPNEAKENIALKEMKTEDLKLECQESHSLVISSDGIQRRHSEPIQQMFSNDVTNLRPISDNFSSKCKRLNEKNGRAVPLRQLRSGSVILLSENDMSVKLTKFKPDVSIIVHQVSKVSSNPALMSGGEVVLEDFADVFKAPDYYADDPFMFGVTFNDIHVNEKNPLERSFSETFVSKSCVSGGKVTDKTTKGISLPELFPSKPDTLICSSVQRHEKVKSFNSESEISLDFSLDTLVAQEITSSNFDFDDIGLSDNDVASMATDVSQDVLEATDSEFSRLRERNDIVPSNELHNKLDSTSSCTSDCTSDSTDKCTHESTAYSL